MKQIVFRKSTKWVNCIGFFAMLALPVSCSTPKEQTSGNSSSSSSSGGGTSNQVCIPGQQIMCACPGGFSGAQACNEQGSGYEPCQCESGTGGNAGAGGMAGMGGAGGMAGMGGAGGMAGMGGAGGMAGMGGAGGGMSCTSMDNKVLAANQLHFGEGNNGEWKTVGFNIDGLLSTSASVDVCQPNSGGSASVAYPDGVNGIDNSFGKNVMPLYLSLYPTFVTDVNNSLQNGNFTMMLAMDCLPPTGDASSLMTRLFNGTSLGMPPKWDGTDPWPVRPELLSDPMNPASSTIIYSNSSVTNLVFDSGNKVPFVLTIPMFNTWITLKLYSAHVTMNLASDHNSATGGIIGGVLNTEEFISEFNKVGSSLGLCNTPLYTNLITTIRQASDIMADGSQDPTKTCDGISIGLSFESAQVQLGGVGPMIPMTTACQ